MTRSLKTRRTRNVCLLIAVAVALLVCGYLQWTALRNTARSSGWILLSLVVFLALYNVRKKLPLLPLGSSADVASVS